MCSAEASAQPEQIGKYRIVGTLGQGAMGRVYLGEDPHIGRKVAVKVLSGATGDEARARFLEEARTIGHLSHPDIVTLLEFGFHEGQPFLAMEHLEGESFERWLTRRPPEARILEVLAGLCRAIDHAHGQGVLHRDVKPSNLQVLEDGRAKLLDFGIARTGSVALTATGMLMGTPQYLAPEVLNGTGHSTASDVYAVGLVAYEALSGESPFAADTLEHCLTRVLTATPTPLAELRPDLPGPLTEAVMACVARQPAERPETLGPLREAIERRLSEASGELATPTVRVRQATSALPASAAGTVDRVPGRRRIVPWVIGAAGALVAGATLLWLLAGPAPPTPEPAGAAPAGSTTRSAEALGPDQQSTRAPADGAAAARDEPGAEDGAPPAPADAQHQAADLSPATERTSGAPRGRPEATPPPSEPVADEPTPSVAPRGAQPAAGTNTGTTAEEADEPTVREGAGGAPPPVATFEETAQGTRTGAQGAPQTASPSSARQPEETSTPPDGGPSEQARETADRASIEAGASTSRAPRTADPATPSARPGASSPEEDPGLVPPAPRLERLSPGDVRRGGVATVVLDGTAFAEGSTIEVRRGGAPVSGVRVRRVSIQDATRIRVTLSVARDVPLGLYSVIVVGPDGRSSNPVELEISL